MREKDLGSGVRRGCRGFADGANPAGLSVLLRWRCCPDRRLALRLIPRPEAPVLARRLFAITLPAAIALPVAIACTQTPTSPSWSAGPRLAEATGLGCPGPFTATNYAFEPGSEEDQADANGDGIACFLDVVDPANGSTIHRTYVDNNVPNRVATCPESFSVAAAKKGDSDDRNLDGLVCQATRPNGNVVVVDNHYDANPNNEPTK